MLQPSLSFKNVCISISSYNNVMHCGMLDDAFIKMYKKYKSELP